MLDAARFEDILVIEAVAKRVCMDWAICTRASSLQLRYADVSLDSVQVAQPMTLAAADRFARTTRPAQWTLTKPRSRDRDGRLHHACYPSELLMSPP